MWTLQNSSDKKPTSLSELKCRTVGIQDKVAGRMHSYQLDTEKKNNVLHNAVINGEIKKAEKVLSTAEENKIDRLMCGTSKLNTPLTLALKHGDITMAKLFLKYINNENSFFILNFKDCHGLTALDWACMLRNDEII